MPPPLRISRLSKQAGPITLHLEASHIGPDICMILHGGASHIGAVATAEPCTTSSALTQIIASAIGITRHKEKELAQELAQMVSAQRGIVVAVVCGIHKDAATREEIILFCETARALVQEFIHSLPPLVENS